MNFLAALACLFVFRHVELSELGQDVLRNAYIVNVILGLFNLIPVPPLDGSRILGAVMDNATYYRWVQLDRYGMFVVFGMFFVFQDEFTGVLVDALDVVTRVMDTIVAA